jgi:shikimate dehydrogenase
MITPRAFAVLGTPIDHSLSAILHTAVFRQLGLPWKTTCVDPGNLEGFTAFVNEMRAGQNGYQGANVTIPYKEAAAGLCDELSSLAQRCGAVNTLLCSKSGLVGNNSDVLGFRGALKSELQLETHDLRRVLICGTGGVARAITTALTEKGSRDLVILSRSRQRAAQFIASMQQDTEDICWRPACYAEIPEVIAEEEEAFDLLVNATPVGMSADEVPALPPSWIKKWVSRIFDTVYRRRGTTPLVHWARRNRLPATDGLAMLVQQAAFSLMMWGVPAKPEEAGAIMLRALVEEGIIR